MGARSRRRRAILIDGSLTVLKATDENTTGAFSMIEERNPAGYSPPMHVHGEDDELFSVLDGVVTFEVDGERLTATAGSTVFVPHGLPHSYLIEEETRWLMFVHKPGLESLWASVVRPTRGRFRTSRQRTTSRWSN